MSKSTRVSVVMIFLNEERFIAEAVESVLNQTYGHWELIFVDDGSLDESTAIALRYKAEHPERIRYFDHPGHQNFGMSASRNLGISHASGEYVAFLDADDVWYPHKLQQQVAVLDTHPEAVMIYGETVRWYSWTGKLEDAQSDFIKNLGVPPDRIYQPPELLVPFLRREAAAPCTCSILVQRKTIEHVSGFEESFRGMYEDQAFYTKIFLHGPVFAAGECWDRYRKHPASCCSVVEASGRETSMRLIYLNWVRQYFKKHRLSDPKLWEALQQEIWSARYPRLSQFFGRARPGIRQIQNLVASITR